MMMRLQSLFVLLTCLSLGGCATYNATVPEWAQIASESTETATAVSYTHLTLPTIYSV